MNMYIILVINLFKNVMDPLFIVVNILNGLKMVLGWARPMIHDPNHFIGGAYNTEQKP